MPGGLAGRLIGALLALGLVLWGLHAAVTALSKHETAQRSAGAAQQRADDLGAAAQKVEQANAARDEVRNPGSRARYDQCLRSARNREVCERYLPQ